MCSELTTPSGVASSSSPHVLFGDSGGVRGKDSGDIGDECKEGKRETSNAVGMVCSDERHDFKGEGAGEDEGAGHSRSE